MKNIRKIVAILAAALMLCSVLPMSAFAVDGDAVWSADFNDGTAVFSPSEIVAEGPDGSNCMKWTANGGWSATWTAVKDMDSTKDYTIAMKAKGSVAGGMGITIQNGDWGSYWNGPSFQVSTEWQDIVIELPAGSIPFTAGTIVFKFQDVGVAMDLYVDDIVISEGLPKKPIITNGDFEEGNVSPWAVNQTASAKAEAAYEGNYGAHLKGNGSWGGIMETTLTVEAGKSYELSFWIKVNKTGINLQIKDGDPSGTSLASGTWYDYNNHSEWTQKTYILTPSTNGIFLNFCGSGGATPNPDMEEDVYIDSIKVRELKDPSFDGYITNGDFETGDTQSWESVWNSAKIEAIEGGHDSDYAMQINFPGQWQVVRQKVTVKPNTDYVYSVYAKDNNGAVLLVKDGADTTNIKQGGIASGSEWKKNSIEFNSGSYSEVYLCVMSNAAGNSVVVDDFFMFEKQPASNDGYLINGTFETGDIAPWDNLWGSCPKAEVVKGGYNDNFSLDIVSGEWKHVRQTNIAVEANTDYKISVYAKNVKNMNLLVKDGADTTNLANVGANGGDEWTLNEVTFNTGANTSVLVSFMGGAAEAYGSFDNIVMEKVAPAHNVIHVPMMNADCQAAGNIEYWTCDICGSIWLDEACTETATLEDVTIAQKDHEALYACDQYCIYCGEKTFPRAKHSILHVEAKEAVNCIEYGNREYWYCEHCNTVALDADLRYLTNMMSVLVAGECESNAAFPCLDGECINCGLPCAAEADHEYTYSCDAHCAVCGELTNEAAAHNVIAVEAKDATCSENGNIAYWYCDICGAAWLDADCTLNTNLRAVVLPATGEHTYDDEYDADCNVCGDVREVPEKPDDEILYGDADGDGEITLLDAGVLSQYLSGYDVEIDLVAGDADGDGEVTLLDAGVLSQYLSGYDVTLGPQEAPLFNDGVLSGWE